VTVRCGDGAGDSRVRFACIDAPELAQVPYGNQIRERLAELLPALVYLRVLDTDRYGRLVAEIITLHGDNLGLAMCREGRAVVYRRYCKDSVYL
jgi:endonuclease YncB( thermonuclease family)